MIFSLKKEHSLDLILLQEARFSKALFSVAGFSFIAAANLYISRYLSGVITAANAHPLSSQYKMSLAREAFITTRKNTLVTIYPFKDQTLLMVVNIHAINFRSFAWYQWELSRLGSLIKLHRGPVVLAGDFNCWKKTRKNFLDSFTRSLNLEHARPRFSKYIKNWFGFRLDRVYSRDLVLVDVQALDCKLFSDHNPIIARFVRQEM